MLAIVVDVMLVFSGDAYVSGGTAWTAKKAAVLGLLLGCPCKPISSPDSGFSAVFRQVLFRSWNGVLASSLFIEYYHIHRHHRVF